MMIGIIHWIHCIRLPSLIHVGRLSVTRRDSLRAPVLSRIQKIVVRLNQSSVCPRRHTMLQVQSINDVDESMSHD